MSRYPRKSRPPNILKHNSEAVHLKMIGIFDVHIACLTCLQKRATLLQKDNFIYINFRLEGGGLCRAEHICAPKCLVPCADKLIIRKQIHIGVQVSHANWLLL